MRHLLAILILLFPTVSLAGTIRPDVKDEEYIEYGQKHKCVLKLNIRNKNEKGEYVNGFGSCTIIAPRVAITAAHLVKGIDDVFVVKSDGSQVKVKYSAFPRLFDGGKIAESFDIAVCYLEEPIVLDFYPEMYRTKDEVEKICSIAGFGATGNHNEGVTVRESKKRAGSNRIDAVINGMLVCTVGPLKRTSLEYLIAPGDSGGGLFIDKKLAGINSNVATIHKDRNPNSDKNDFACHTRVSNHAGWIDQCIGIFQKIDKGASE
jgi:hypothetical protein